MVSAVQQVVRRLLGRAALDSRLSVPSTDPARDLGSRKSEPESGANSRQVGVGARLLSSPAPQLELSLDELDPNLSRRALDELFALSHQYRSSTAYHGLVQFIARFRWYAPYNAMLVHIQRPGATFVASPSRWLNQYGRSIRPGANPLVILQPKGPVMFVFDVSDTERLLDTPDLPLEVDRPFAVSGQRIGGKLQKTIENALRDGILVEERDAGSQSAGEIRIVRSTGQLLRFPVRMVPEPKYISVPRRYAILLNRKHSEESKYATLVHELAHLYCGHLGTPDTRWWPDRSDLSHKIMELEAESVSYLLCARLGMQTPSEKYLSNFVQGHETMPSISLEAVMKSAGLIEQMGRSRLPARPAIRTKSR